MRHAPALLPPFRIHDAGPSRVDAHLREVFVHWAELAEVGVPARLQHRDSMLWCLGSQATADEGLVHDALLRLRRLTLPALLIAGGDDRLMPPRHAEALAKAIPEAGRPVHREAAEAFTREVMRFLAAGGPT